ncbi:MAG: hydrogenase nickel incorporation protein HypB [candidate division Zixibacteria bacterium]|nr:hydrogenase nickel incorporation protein HypB [Candidatus Tariuqbacter arcticus]
MEIPVIRDVLEESNAIARENRAVFDRNRVFVVNLMSSPGSGKTTLLQKTIPVLTELGIKCAVIEGDITSTLDSERLKPLGIPIVQANTEPFGGDCHVGSHFIKASLEHLDLTSIQLLFIENIGNLVCPAEFYLGEDRKVVMLSLTEGEDKPLKYPLMFRECHLCLLSKVDLAPHLDIDISVLESNICKINSQLNVIFVSAKTGEGISTWIDWLMNQKGNLNRIED